MSESLLESIAKSDARRTFGGFMRRIDIPGAPSKVVDEAERFLIEPPELPAHIEVAARIVDRCLNGEIPGALFFWPPGTAKSTTISQCAPAYAMGKFPENRIVSTSWGFPLARTQSRRARQICKSPAYEAIFQEGLDPATRSVEEWRLTNGSELYASAIDGAVGRRARVAIFDDPFKNRKSASSPTQRQTIKEAIFDDLLSRIIPGGCALGMFTRYVFDDPAAWLLGEDYDGRSGFVTGPDGRKWFVMNCPAEAFRPDDPLGRKTGEYIWPERFPASFWQPFKAIDRTWASLYQQTPNPEGGLLFKREWFEGRIVKRADLPKYMQRGRGWDWGGSTREENPEADASASVKMSRAGEKLFVEHAWTAHESPRGVDVALDAQVRKDGPGVIQCLPQDPAQAGKDQAERRRAIAVRAGANEVRVSPEYGGKIYRADTFSSQCEQGHVYLVDDGSWDIGRYLDQLCAFPVGKHDDLVDASSRVCNELMQVATIKRAQTGF